MPGTAAAAPAVARELDDEHGFIPIGVDVNGDVAATALIRWLPRGAPGGGPAWRHQNFSGVTAPGHTWAAEPASSRRTCSLSASRLRASAATCAQPSARVVRCSCAHGYAKVTGRYREWSIAGSGQSGNDLSVFVFGEGPQGLGSHVAGTADREGNLRGSGVVGCLADRDDVVPGPW